MPDDAAGLRDAFFSPPPDARPTPLYWWSGADVRRDKLSAHLDLLAEKGVGGTILGYSHRLDGTLDHGDPVPFSAEWWELLRWFAQQSGQRGLTVGIQDYGIVGPMLISVERQTESLHGGSLTQQLHQASGGTAIVVDPGGAQIVSALAWPRDEGAESPRRMTVDLPSGASPLWEPPAGEWTISAVLRHHGRIGPTETTFDPLHPGSGRAVIERFYQPFAEHLGDLFGTVFTTFFQDELDLGLIMPMWNDAIAAACDDAGHPPAIWVHALWNDLGPDTVAFRALHRDLVVRALEDHYFAPIFEWHERHATRLVMDQMSRGDLRAGHKHYADFMQVMSWYHGPGNDDPDLTGPRSLAAFRVSASIAHMHDRPLVVNEGFHSSGWGVTPADVVRGANAGFVSGATHLILHGLYHSTEGGWWEWASPDFHFRQPWWRHSQGLWSYLTRISALLRAGDDVTPVGIVDPTQELAMSGAAPRSPETARALLEGLGSRGVNADLVPMQSLAESVTQHGELRVGSARYRAIVVPAIATMRSAALEALERFRADGGTVIWFGHPASASERGEWEPSDRRMPPRVVEGLDELAADLRAAVEPAIDVDHPGVAFVHRTSPGEDVAFCVNLTDEPISTDVLVPAGAVERWDPWTGTAHPSTPERRADGRLAVPVTLQPGESAVIAAHPGPASASPVPASAAPTARIALEGPWSVTLEPTLDNTFGDFEHGAQPLGVETWHLESSPGADGPWSAATVRTGVGFYALGPMPPDAAADLAERFSQIVELDPDAPVVVEGETLHWKPYAFARETGVDDDPVLLERRTGPHGLKGVPDEFLSPRVLTPEPPVGSAYVFWTTVSARPGAGLTVATRAGLAVWMGGVAVADRAEIAVRSFEPWGLLDLEPVRTRHATHLTGDRTGLTVAVTISADQPTRAGIGVGGDGGATTSMSRMSWWSGSGPCVFFEPRTIRDRATTWVRSVVPPGATAATVTADGEVLSAVADGRACVTRHGLATGGAVSTFELPPDSRSLVMEIRDPHASGAGALREPIRWECGTARRDPASWPSWGLADFSGIVRYRTEVHLPGAVADSSVLVVAGLVGSAAVVVNGESAPSALLVTDRVEVGALLRDGVNVIEIEVANTLANYYARLPSPYSSMQPVGGGFSSAWLLTAPVEGQAGAGTTPVVDSRTTSS